MPHVRRRLLIGLVAAAVVAGGVAAVLVTRSDDDEGGCGSGYPETPRCMAEAFVLRDDASKCDLVDPSVLAEVMGVTGPNARERCAAVVTARPGPKTIEILKVEQEGAGGEEEGEREAEEGGREAEAEVEFLADGKEGEIVLRREDGRWRIVALGKG